MYKWAGITFVVLMVLLILDIYLSSKQKEGITPGDKRRFWGIFWIGVMMSILVGVLVGLWLEVD